MAYFNQACAQEPLPSGAIIPAGSLTRASSSGLSPFAGFHSALMAARKQIPQSVAASVASLLKRSGVASSISRNEAFFLVVEQLESLPDVWMLHGVKRINSSELEYKSATESSGMYSSSLPRSLAEATCSMLPALKEAVLEELERQLAGTGIYAQWVFRYIPVNGSTGPRRTLLHVTWDY